MTTAAGVAAAVALVGAVIAAALLPTRAAAEAGEAEVAEGAALEPATAYWVRPGRPKDARAALPSGHAPRDPPGARG